MVRKSSASVSGTASPGPAIKEHIPSQVYEAQVGMMEMVLDVEKLSQVVEKVRRDGSKMA